MAHHSSGNPVASAVLQFSYFTLIFFAAAYHKLLLTKRKFQLSGTEFSAQKITLPEIHIYVGSGIYLYIP